MKRILALTLCASCSWGLGETRGYVAARKEVSMCAVVANVNVIERELESATEQVRETIMPHVRAIRTRAVDDIEIAKIEQMDHGYMPKKAPVIDSEEDVFMLNAHAGKTHARDTRRKHMREIPARILKFAANVVKNVIPKWVRWLLGGAIVFIVISFVANVVLWIRSRFNRSAAEQLAVLANKHIAKSILESTRGTPAQKVFYRARDAGLLGVPENRPRPGTKE